MNLRLLSTCLVLVGMSLPAIPPECQILGPVALAAQAPPSSGTGKLRIYDVPEPAEELAQDPAEREDFLRIEQSSDPTQRTGLIEAFVQQYPESNYLGSVHHLATLDYQSLNQPEKMLEHGQKTLRHSPDNIPILVLMALARSSKGEPDRSIQLATRALGRLQKIVRPANTDQQQWEAEYRRYMAQSLAGLGHAYLVKYEIERQASKEASPSGESPPGQAGPQAGSSQPKSPGTGTAGRPKLATLHLGAGLRISHQIAGCGTTVPIRSLPIGSGVDSIDAIPASHECLCPSFPSRRQLSTDFPPQPRVSLPHNAPELAGRPARPAGSGPGGSGWRQREAGPGGRGFLPGRFGVIASQVFGREC